MALLERDIMIGSSSEEFTTTQNSPSQEYPAEKVKEFRETSNPGDIFNTATLEIKRNNSHEVSHFHNIDTITNINDASTELVIKELEAKKQTFKPARRRGLSQLKYTTVSILTSVIR
jgi:hypothetical protein